ncbi:MAG: SdpI family protein [Eubacteriales bacterium]
MFIYFVIMVMLIPITMLGFGLLWRNHPPRKINSAYGYRTTMSSKNKDTWDYAHRYFGNICLRTGLAASILSAAAMFICRNNYENASIVIIIIQMFILWIPIIPTEKALKQKFDKNGNRKNMFPDK